MGAGTGGQLLALQGAYLAYVELHKPNFYINFSGIENNKHLLPIAERQRTNVTLRDAFKVDYSQFDIVYYYHPIITPALQAQLEEQIEKQIKKGSYIMAFLKENPLDSKAFRTTKLSGWGDQARVQPIRRSDAALIYKKK